MRAIHGAVAAVVMATAACSMPSMEGNAERAAEAQAFYADLVADRQDQVLTRMSSANNSEQIRAQLAILRPLIPPGEAPEGKSLGWRMFAGTDGQRYTLTREYDYVDRVAQVETTFVQEGETWKVEGFHLNVLAKPGSAPAPAPAPAESKAGT